MTNTTINPDLPFEVFEEEMIDPLSGVEMTEAERFIAGLILESHSEKPIKQAEIITAVRHGIGGSVSERQVRSIVRNLRRRHGFPICTRKGAPAGYYWGRTEADLADFTQVWMSQYKDEAQTLHIMLKKNYPKLAGQMKLALEE